jgi:L-ascorbate metabolism protein UlaG (beta-lactamase superfamily)
MTYVANEGFLISGAGQKVLIDALFTEGWGQYQIPSGEVLARMRDAAPPYDRVTVLLLTHRDGDHVDPASVIAHLRNDSACVLIGPAQVNELLQAQPGYDVVKARIFAVPRTPAVFERMVQGLRFKTVLLDHDGDSPTEPASSHNVGHLFTVGGIKFLHAGDAGAAGFEAVRRYRLAEENLDVLIAPWFLFNEQNAEITRSVVHYLKPKAIVPVHFPTRASAALLVPADRTKDLPPVFSMEKPMTALAFDRKGTDLMVTRIDGAPGNER